MSLVVFADGNVNLASKIETLLKKGPAVEFVHAVTPSLTSELLKTRDVHVLVIGPSTPLDEALQLGAAVSAQQPPVSVVLITPRVSTDILRSALKAGFRDVVSAEEQTYGDIVAAIREAQEATARARSGGEASASGNGHKASVVTVFGTKGGVGKSVIATNLAVALTNGGGKRVILLDLDLQFGDTGIMLQIEPERTIYDAVQAFDRLDASMLAGFLSDHKSGLRVLLPPVRPEEAESVTAARIDKIISLLSEIADVIVIDTPPVLNDAVLTALDKSDQVLAVVTLDVASVKNSRISLQKLEQLGFQPSSVRLVVNRADSKVWLELADVEKALGGRIEAKIPSDRLVPRSVNRGVPVVVDAPKSAVARSIVEFSKTIAIPNGGDESDVHGQAHGRGAA